MTYELLLNELWQATLRQLGGAAAIEASACETRAFLRPRAVKSATDLLRLILAYCLGGMGFEIDKRVGCVCRPPGPFQCCFAAAPA